jgi:hypothetical protein
MSYPITKVMTIFETFSVLNLNFHMFNTKSISAAFKQFFLKRTQYFTGEKIFQGLESETVKLNVAELLFNTCMYYAIVF